MIIHNCEQGSEEWQQTQMRRGDDEPRQGAADGRERQDTPILYP